MLSQSARALREVAKAMLVRRKAEDEQLIRDASAFATALLTGRELVEGRALKLLPDCLYEHPAELRRVLEETFVAAYLWGVAVPNDPPNQLVEDIVVGEGRD